MFIKKEKAELVILDFWRVDKELYAISKATKEILRISIKEKKVLNYYPIRVELDESLGNSILAGNSIFTVLKNNKAVHEFNII